MSNFLCISACTVSEKGGGLYTYRLSDEGRLAKLSYFPTDNPMYTILNDNRIYCIGRNLFGNESGIFDILTDENGGFGEAGRPQSTHGNEACHLCADGDDVYTVNYSSGSVIKLPDKLVEYEGHGINPARQEAAHTHCVIFSPDKECILVSDLGLDRINVLDRDMNPISSASVPFGHGVRHFIFSHDGKYLYCVNELEATLSVFSWDAGEKVLSYINTYSIDIPDNIKPYNTAAAIRQSKDGHKVYISNRGENTIVAFDTENGTDFTLSQKISCGGKGPRDFNITDDERFLICTNEGSDSVTVFSLHNGIIGEMTDIITLPSPLCVMML